MVLPEEVPIAVAEPIQKPRGSLNIAKQQRQLAPDHHAQIIPDRRPVGNTTSVIERCRHRQSQHCNTPDRATEK